jgi:valyl-tRNA synthetase
MSSVSFSQAAPTYTKVSFSSDPSAFSLNAVPPDSVSDSIDEFSLSSDFTDAMVNIESFLDGEDSEMVASAVQRAQISLQQSLNTFTSDMQKFQASGTGKFSAEVAAYQADVTAEVQEYTQKLQRGLQIYSTDMQQELNEFNKENAEYQAQLQISLKNAEFDNQEDARKVQKYQAEYAGYTAEVTSQVQEYTQNLQADGVGYQWLQGQYAALKAEYDQAFMMAAPKQQPQQVRR